ncbi:glycosyltransferase [Leifsonia aquatica]|uniref:glycosyltransferase n=1 Tax=Leifsonia aquatica TaxID=144185 RepID=UPI003817BCB4
MTVEHVIVAVPARDEEETLAACLESVLVASAHVEVPVTVVVVLDGCVDASAEIARRFAGVLIVERDHGNVGRARQDGVAVGLAQAASAPERTWIAFTDADTVVPRMWLQAHLAAAESADLFVGAVVPRLDDLDAARRHAWTRSHPPGATLGHVHGANLGVRASAYAAVGGVPPLVVGEDVDLVARVRASGRPVVESEQHPVLTSARLDGRAPDGYAAHLRALVS